MGKGDNTIKNKIVIEGEAKYKKELADINRSLKESKSAMKAAAAEMDGAQDSMLAMYQQGDALERVLSDQTAALELMENHLVKVEAAYGKNSREAVELRTKINNARAEMAKTSNELRDLKNRLDQAADGMEDTEKAANGLDGDLKNIGGGAKDAKDDVGDLADELKDVSGIDLGDIAGKIGGIAAVGTGLSGALTLGESTVDSWNQLAAYTGATEEKLAQLKEDARAVASTGIGGDLGNVTQSVAAVNQQTGLTGASLQDCTKYAIALSDTFGMDVGESARTAAQLMDTFGISGQKAYDLITVGAQNGADKNGNLLDTINEYSPYFKDAGKDADEMFAAIITGAQNGVYDVDKIGDSWKEFMLRITGGDEGAKEALKDLGFAAGDVTKKIAEGGPAADLATAQIIDALANCQDPYEQNQLAVALFGTQWEDVAGKVLPAFDNMEGGLDDVTGAAQNLVDVKYDDLSTSWDALKNKVAALAEPALLAGVNALNEALDRMGQAVTAAGEGDIEGVVRALAPELTEPSAEMVAQTEAAMGASQDLRAELALLDEQINTAFASGDNKTGWTLTAQREALLAEIVLVEQEAVAAMTTAGESMATALEDTSGDMESAAGVVGDSAVTATEDAQPDMMDAGKGMGTSETLGYQAGSAGMYQAGVDSASGAVSGMRTGISAAYSAGYQTGQAYARGYKTALEIRSPSHVMQEAAEFTTDPLFDSFEADRIRLQEAGAALGEAVRSGYGNPFGDGENAAASEFGAGNDGLTAEKIGRATAGALAGMGVYFGTERVGEIIEQPVSQATTRRAMGTIRGQSALVKGW